MKTNAVQKTVRAKKIAVIEAWCTGCAGTPVCMVYCRQNALIAIRDEQSPPFLVMTVDPSRCVGCGACLTKGAQGTMMTGCPYNAIRIDKIC